MKNAPQFSTTISNEEHIKRAEKTYNEKVLPNLEENRKFYAEYMRNKKALKLTPEQKAYLRIFEKPF